MSQLDSEDEREVAAAQTALSHKIRSQLNKKSKKNQARLPRTAGLRTLTELTEELTKAGLDPSRIQERAERLAKIQAAQRKRKRNEEEDAEMDVDEEGDWEDEDEDGMNVDGEEGRPSSKRVKTNEGGAVAKRVPRSDRTLAGLRDEAVRVFSLPSWLFT
jgi:nucleolar GTP-binding protein